MPREARLWSVGPVPLDKRLGGERGSLLTPQQWKRGLFQRGKGRRCTPHWSNTLSKKGRSNSAASSPFWYWPSSSIRLVKRLRSSFTVDSVRCFYLASRYRENEITRCPATVPVDRARRHAAAPIAELPLPGSAESPAARG